MPAASKFYGPLSTISGQRRVVGPARSPTAKHQPPVPCSGWFAPIVEQFSLVHTFTYLPMIILPD
jgi:hypothetical protein